MNSREYSTGLNPCFKCQNRFLGCHDICKDFNEWKKKHIVEKNKQAAVEHKEGMLNSIRNQGIINIKTLRPTNKIIKSKKKF